MNIRTRKISQHNRLRRLHQGHKLRSLVSLPLIRMKTSSRCHVSPGRDRRRGNWLALACPNFAR